MKKLLFVLSVITVLMCSCSKPEYAKVGEAFLEKIFNNEDDIQQYLHSEISSSDMKKMVKSMKILEPALKQESYDFKYIIGYEEDTEYEETRTVEAYYTVNDIKDFICSIDFVREENKWKVTDIYMEETNDLIEEYANDINRLNKSKDDKDENDIDYYQNEVKNEEKLLNAIKGIFDDTQMDMFKKAKSKK